MTHKTQLWTVRNRKGQFIGTYYAATAAQAIDRLVQDQITQASQFKHVSVPKHSDFTAAVESRP